MRQDAGCCCVCGLPVLLDGIADIALSDACGFGFQKKELADTLLVLGEVCMESGECTSASSLPSPPQCHLVLLPYIGAFWPSSFEVFLC